MDHQTKFRRDQLTYAAVIRGQQTDTLLYSLDNCRQLVCSVLQLLQNTQTRVLHTYKHMSVLISGLCLDNLSLDEITSSTL